MKWFVASLVSTIILEEKEQDDFPVYEEFYLFSASSEDELQNKISDMGSLINKAGEAGIQYNGKRAKQIYLGARKTRAVYNDIGDGLNTDPPADGAELSHSFYIVRSLEEAAALSKGEAVVATYLDDSELQE